MEKKSPRELAARALCRLSDLPEDTRIEGVPAWRLFLPHVDAVLQAALSREEYFRLRDE
jgi:hypothetical protein